MRTLLLAALLAGIVSAVFAANPAPPAPSSSPDVLVLILSVMEPYDYISINYATAIPKAQAAADLHALTSQTGWKAENVEITTKSVDMPGAQPTTSTAFQTIRVSNSVDGTLPLSPFIDALKRFKNIEVTFAPPSGFRFNGLGDYTNQYVNVKLAQAGRSYTYKVNVKDSSFSRINLPLKPAPKPKPQEATHTSSGARTLLIAGIAVVGAAVAYFITMYLSSRRTS